MAKEIYKAIVSRTNDDKKLGRVKVKCDGLAANGKELPYWIEPIYPIAADGWGWFYVPDVGDEVEIEITIHDHTDETHGESIVSNPDIRYRAGAYSPGQKVPDELKTNYGKRIGMKTRAGHLFIFDDKEGSEEIALTAGKGKITITAEKEVNIVAGSGATVNVNGSDSAMILDTLLGDLASLASALSAPVAPAGIAGGPCTFVGMATITEIITKLSGIVYKSTKAKHG